MEPLDQGPQQAQGARPSYAQVDDCTYRVLHVREGGMGKVWILERDDAAAWDPIYTRRLAVKSFSVGDDESIRRELNCWISLQHHCILPLRKIGRVEYQLAAIMPWMPTSLEDMLEEQGSFEERTVLHALQATAHALAYAWSAHQMLHLDIKPSNILFDSNSRRPVQVADWGISRIAELKGTRRVHAIGKDFGGQKTTYSAGTPLFMSPERFSGRWKLSPAADIFSLGMTALYLATGVLPFRFGEIDPFDEIVQGRYVDNASVLLNRATPQFRDLVLSCLQFESSKRPQTYEAVNRLIARAL